MMTEADMAEATPDVQVEEEPVVVAKAEEPVVAKSKEPVNWTPRRKKVKTTPPCNSFYEIQSQTIETLYRKMSTLRNQIENSTNASHTTELVVSVREIATTIHALHKLLPQREE